MRENKEQNMRMTDKRVRSGRNLREVALVFSVIEQDLPVRRNIPLSDE
jgi:hypothetical protein